MEEEKILVYTETKQKTEFYNSVDNCRDRVNSLIEIFDTFVTFDNEKITSVEDFESLCRDPRSYFDACVLRNIQLSAGKKFNIEIACQLFDIRRTEYLNMVDGLPILDDTCIPCKKVKVKKGQRVIFISEYNHYKDFLTFANRRFSVNEAAVEDHVKSFDIYADGIEQLDVFTHFKDLVAILNIHAQKYGLNMTDRQTIAKILHLYLTRAIEGDFMTDNEFVKNKILNLKYNDNRIN